MKIAREIINQFKEWKKTERHKPILLKGARQIGKTWAMEPLDEWSHIERKHQYVAVLLQILGVNQIPLGYNFRILLAEVIK